MPSVIPPRPICTGCLNQSSRKIEQLTGMYMNMNHGCNKSNSNFLGMSGRKRKNKKRPPPISISTRSADALIAGNTFNSRAGHDGYWTPPTPQASPPVPCMKQLCKEVHDYLIATPTFSQQKNYPEHIWPPRITSSIMSSDELPAELPANLSAELAELPGSQPPQQHTHTEQLHELDASSPSNPTCLKIEKRDSTPLEETPETTPELSPSSATTGSEMEAPFCQSSSSSSSQSSEPVRNGKQLSVMNIGELLEVYHDLSSTEIDEYWLPLVAKECAVMKETLNGYRFQRAPRYMNSREAEERKREYTIEVTSVKKQCENALKEKDAELDTLKTAYESKAAILSTFIDRYHDIRFSKDPYAPSVHDLVSKHSLLREKPTNPGVTGDYIYVSEKEHTERSLELEMIRLQLEDLGRLASHYEDKSKTYSTQNKNLRQEIKQYRREEFQRSKDMVDKDLQIASLNLKVTQLMKVQPSQSVHRSNSSPSKHYYNSAAPSPNLSEWKKHEEMEEKFREEVKQKEREVSILRFKEDMMTRLPEYIREPVDFSPRSSAEAAPEPDDKFLNRFQTLSVQGGEYPFFMANTK